MIRLVIGDLQRIPDFERKLHDEINRSNRQLQDAILKLSANEVAVNILLLALRESVIHNEILWREIEQRDDFKAKYGNNRNLAREYFLYVCTRRKGQNI